MEEEQQWEGTPSQIVNLTTYVVCLILAGLCIAPLRMPFVYGALIPLGYAALVWVELRFKRIRLSNQRLQMIRGILSRQTDEIELYRIKDTQLIEPFLYRLVGAGNIILYTSDRSNPEVQLTAIPKAGEVREQIRQLVEEIRVQKGVREID